MKENKKENKSGLSRRDFLKNVELAVGGAVLGSASLLSSGAASKAIASTASSKPVTGDCQPVDQDDVKPIPPVGPPAVWDEQADIVVVGLGGGVVGAAKAAQMGSSVIAVEKMSLVGGTTWHAGVLLTFGAKKIPKAPGAPAFDLEKALRKAVVESRFTLNEALTRATIIKCGEMVDWLTDLGVEWSTNLFGTAYSPEFKDDPKHLGHAAMRGAINAAYAYMNKKGGKTILNTKVVALVIDKGRIVGVKATGLLKDNTIFIKANKAVILSAGGFSHNKNMLKKYVPSAYNGVGSVSMALPSNTGECIRMGQGVGADLAGYDTFTGFDGGIDFSEVNGPWFRYLYSGDIQLARGAWLHLNKSCERFMNISSSPMQFFARPAAIMAQPGNRAYVIFDKNYEENIWKLKPVGCKVPVTPDLPLMNDWFIPRLGSADWKIRAKEAIAMGAIKSSDTLEGLAVKLGLEPARFKAAVMKWNSYCKAGTDPEFGELPQYLIPVQDPPFYGTKIGCSMGSTSCGLRVNQNMQVLDVNQNIIPGLYATYFTAGGGAGEIGFGNPVVWCAGGSMTTAYMAGEHAAKQAG
ncbi:MAG: FAD-binding protein [Desulfobacterium sp.]|nr:FAD-binding protein [Desulfobacterium sp.]MBU3948881.1 FAD-binding protein [Pseudomonadota bacterium]MBU4011477.1 FAD-binding protein [Pseudomonadota bacterium]MBU4035217.1 FAD-binding protein [Pseudomonadota bacterium]